MKKIARSLALAVAFFAMLSCNSEVNTQVVSQGELPIPCGRPCVIQGSRGGSILNFRVEGFALLHLGIPVIVDGPCYSACTLLIDVARKNVCLTTRALLGYHQARSVDAAGKIESFSMLSYETPGLNEYFMTRGGLPASTDMLLVTFEDAIKFYPPCPGALQ